LLASRMKSLPFGPGFGRPGTLPPCGRPIERLLRPRRPRSRTRSRTMGYLFSSSSLLLLFFFLLCLIGALPLDGGSYPAPGRPRPRRRRRRLICATRWRFCDAMGVIALLNNNAHAKLSHVVREQIDFIRSAIESNDVDVYYAAEPVPAVSPTASSRAPPPSTTTMLMCGRRTATTSTAAEPVPAVSPTASSRAPPPSTTTMLMCGRRTATTAALPTASSRAPRTTPTIESNDVDVYCVVAPPVLVQQTTS
jgi:hypothetical protein